MSNHSLVSAPLFLWNLYIDNLWNYERGSWVGRTASTCRVLAIFVLTPFIILTMLDVASYVIARTLGVIDVTSASTGGVAIPGAMVSAGDVPSIKVLEASPDVSRHNIDSMEDTAPYFRDNMVAEGNLKLSGVDAFSPAPSQPSSPTLSRRDSHGHIPHQLHLTPLAELTEKKLRRRERSYTSSSSGGSADSKGEDRDSGSEGKESIRIRRRGAAKAGPDDSP